VIKYASNAFLAAKITFINEIADLCESIDADVHDVARGMGLDGRIGRKFLHPGPGYGGSCFPKDTLALAQIAEGTGIHLRIVESVIQINEARKKRMAMKIIEACGGSVCGRTIAVLGLTFKPNTDDMREAPSLHIIPALIGAGATVRVFDPEGMSEARKLLDGVVWCESAYETVTDADALAILTEWNEFRALDVARLRIMMRAPIICDFRNIYNPAQMSAAGFYYTSIGRPAVHPQVTPDQSSSLNDVLC
jgi:UDPglucose 6-dehydrogenase